MKEKTMEFFKGMHHGIPIAFGYLPVSFSFGMTAVASGVPVWAVIVISMTNLTSAGQFAGTNLIAGGAPFIEIAVTTFVINLRYMLMSLALSQKIERMPLAHRLITAFGVTDEIFSVSVIRKGRLSFPYMLGLMSMPYVGWTLGTVCGAFVNNIIPEAIASVLGIMLYAMFIAIVVPAARKNIAVAAVALTAAAVSCMLRYVRGFSEISSGWAIIISTVIASAIGASLFPHKGED